jgi:hypothetical protein
LAVSCVFTRGQALLAKQMCLQVAAVGTPAGHLAFWLGLAVGYYIPCLAAVSHAARPPSGLLQAGEVLVELFSHGMVSPNGLAGVRTAVIYGSFLVTPPPPKVEAKWPWDWCRVWAGLWGSGLPPAIVEKMFLLIHNILPLKGWLPLVWWPRAAALTVVLWKLPATFSSCPLALLTCGTASMRGW